MLSPLPVVLVSCGNEEIGTNLFTVAWAGTVCTQPAMVSISVRPSRHSYDLIRQTGEFVINLTNRSLLRATDWCGVVSGRDTNKWLQTGLTPVCGRTVGAPYVAESPLSIECKVKQVLELGSHHMFLADVTAVRVDGRYVDDVSGALDLSRCQLITYMHGGYYEVGKKIGFFGYSVQKKRKTRKR